MNLVTVAIGVFFVSIACLFLYRSLNHDEATGKLKAMIDYWGRGKGLWLYRLAYVGIPIFFGTVVIIAGVNGNTFSEFLNY
ncbi:MAG: hypothetical protein KZQ93_20230 [Candidatus Thiodiazotropha sp. (ex Monitilora ramsayi)]|nr:hypothetical protein [Candidatus Thiodiazotropha sp. (ex Monitilora ramsayi)]